VRPIWYQVEQYENLVLPQHSASKQFAYPQLSQRLAERVLDERLV
jgi:hypothetical protein